MVGAAVHQNGVELCGTVELLYKGTLKSITTFNNSHHYRVNVINTIENNL